MATDRDDGTSVVSDIDLNLDNGVGVGSITPAIHNTLLGDAFKTASFFNGMKYVVNQSGVPSAGEISLNGGQFDTATTIHVSKTTDHSNNVGAILAFIVAGTIVHIKDFSGKFGEFTVSGVVDNGTYYTLTVTATSGNPAYAPTGLEGWCQVYGVVSSGDGIYGGSGSILVATTVTMGSNALTFLGATNAIQIKDGVLTSSSTAQDVYLDGASNKLASQNSTIGHGEHSLLFQDNPNVTGVDCTLPLESGLILVVPDFNTLVANPTATEDGYGISWDDGAGEYVLKNPLDGSILGASYTMTANQTQDLNGKTLIFSNGFFAIDSSAFAVSSTSIALLESPLSSTEYSLGASSTAISVDLSKGNDFLINATDDFTLNFSNAPSATGASQKGLIRIVQDSTPRTITFGANVISTGGATPTLTSAAGSIDILEYQYNQTLAKFIITDWYLDVK